MIKCCLIYYNINSQGIRSLAAYLHKYTNAEIKLLLFPTHIGRTFPEHVITQILEECAGFDIVGFSVATNWYICTNQLAITLKNKLGVKIVYGGIHPTSYPEDCLNYADAVCIGEGEEAMAELINRYEKEGAIGHNIKNFYIRETDGNHIIKNDVRPLMEDLDDIPPFPFFEIEEKIFHRGEFRNLTVTLYKYYMPSFYMTIATRGCLFSCTYCCNRMLKRIYEGQKLFRRRSWENLFAELHVARSKLPFIKNIFLNDDLFFCPARR